MNLQLLNRIAKERSGYIPLYSLEEERPYKIKSFESYENKENDWGNRVRVNLSDGGYVILPSRFNRLLKDDQLKKLTKEKLNIVYKGKDGQFALIEFQNQIDSGPERKRIRPNAAINLKDVLNEKYEVSSEEE